MKLKELIKESRNNEKLTGKGFTVYRVFENEVLIYVGLGGKGKRPGSGRLAEHNSTSLFSSFRHQYYMDKWYKGNTPDEAMAMWDNLSWDAIYCESIRTMEEMESSIIRAVQPYFNRNKK